MFTTAWPFYLCSYVTQVSVRGEKHISADSMRVLMNDSGLKGLHGPRRSSTCFYTMETLKPADVPQPLCAVLSWRLNVHHPSLQVCVFEIREWIPSDAERLTGFYLFNSLFCSTSCTTFNFFFIEIWVLANVWLLKPVLWHILQFRNENLHMQRQQWQASAPCLPAVLVISD